MHIHLDTTGGIAGNMFTAALLDLWPDLAAQLPAQLKSAGFADLVTLAVSPKNDGVLAGTYVAVHEAVKTGKAVMSPKTAKHAAQEHPHRSWLQIRKLLEDSALAPKVKTHALGIFAYLAAAEAKVHGKKVDTVEFHEVGAWDSIADVVCAAFLIEASGASSWSVSSLPLGKGRVQTAHGSLPVPAPAVAVLLQGFVFVDDGLEGERITPTGAAILRYLQPQQQGRQTPRVLRKTGYGFGSRTFPGISNVLRALVFEEAATAEVVSAANAPEQDSISILSFEVDDQSPEDLSVALERIRKHPGVLDVLQYPVYGKKQRLASSIRVLVGSDAVAAVQDLCFVQTTTIGIRLEQCSRKVLPRWIETVELEGRTYRSKMAQRPDGELTAKVELDDLAALPLDHAERILLRAVVEGLAVEQYLARMEHDMDAQEKNRAGQG